MNYLKYKIPYDLINEKIKLLNSKNIVFYIDLNSIARGFYNRSIILEELSNYIEHKKLPVLLLKELKIFLNNLHSYYKTLNPKFYIFYDNGENYQNKSVSSKYKFNRTNQSKTYILNDEERALYYEIKNYYFEEIKNKFSIKNLCKVVSLDKYESDFVPYYAISNYKFFKNPDVINIILSVDKDLLQCCKFENTFQAISVFLPSKSQIVSKVYDNNNAIEYISKNNKHSITSDYIPLILAISGDRQDGIPTLKKGLGVASTINMIKLYDMPPDFNSTYNLPEDLKEFRIKLQTNLDLTSFERQIERIPKKILALI